MYERGLSTYVQQFDGFQSSKLLLAGLEVEEVYFNMLNGVNMKGEKVGRVDYLSLGGSLKVLLYRWLALW